ncbi:hypothetical protein [Streptomyces sp. NBC_01207]|nr:hypothetical protein OG457_31315 [Streptomyces sp. NBC_01207]
MTDDNEHQEHAHTSRPCAVALTLGAVEWITCVALIVAWGWGS